MTFTETQFGNLKSLLAQSLGDVGKVFFTEDDLTFAIHEAISLFQSLSNYWREIATFNPVEDNRWTVLSSTATELVNVSGEKVLQSQFSDRALLQTLLLTLLEPLPSNWADATWGLSDQFSRSEIIAALNRAYSRFFFLSGSMVRVHTIVLSPGQEWFDLPERTVDVRAAAFIPIDSDTSLIDPDKRYHLSRTSRADFDFYNSFSSDSNIPLSYTFEADTGRLRICPPTIDAGNLEVLLYEIPIADLTPEENQTLLEIPPNLWWILKYGTLAELLRGDGQGQDWARAEYCEQRFQDGIQFVKLQIPTIFNARVNDVQVPISNLSDEDSYRPYWSEEIGVANRVVVASWDLIALVPIRRTGEIETAIEFLVSQRIPLPVSDEDKLQIGKEHLTVILDYAKHCCLLKTSGAEFAQSMGAYKKLFEAAAEFNAMLKASTRNFSFAKGHSTRDRDGRYRFKSGDREEEVVA